jgi:hypothetical protein
MTKWWHLAMILSLALPLSAEEQKTARPDGTKHDPPAEGKPWWDSDTGFGLPQNLKGFKMQGWFEYATKPLGVSVRMVNGEEQARADVYVYPCPLPCATDAEAQKAIKDELDNSVSGVYGMQKRGVYSEVKHQNATLDRIKLLSGGSLPLLGAIVTMKIHEALGNGGNAVTSWHGITLLKGKFIKVRYTFPTSKGEEGEKLLNDFVDAWKWCVREPSLRAEALAQVRTYLADPLSEGAEKAAANLMILYAEKSQFNSLTIGGRIKDILEGAAKASKGADLDLLRAFIVGSIDSCLRNEITSDPEAGAAEVVRVYRLLQKRNADFKVPVVDELATAVNQKKATAWLAMPEKKG